MADPLAGGSATDARPSPLGILACAGALPIEIARLVQGRGRPVHIVAIEGFADDGVRRFPNERVGLGQIAHMIRSFRKAGCAEMVIAGAMRRPNLLRLKPDIGLLRHLPTILSLTRGGDDSVLRRIVRFFEGEGFRVRGVGDVAPELMPPEGRLGRAQTSPRDAAAIARAARALEALGDFDIGQAAVASGDRVIAIESARGTDAMLGALAAAGGAPGGVLVKLAKPGQELRVDLPTIGPRTIAGARAAGLSGIAIGAGRALVLERAATIEAADAAGLFVAGIVPPTSIDRTPVPDNRLLAVVSRRAPTPSDRGDVGMGRRLAPVLRSEGLGHAALISGRHVLAVSATAGVAALIADCGRDSQWGRRAFRSRLGTLILDLTGPEELLTQEMFQAAAAANLAGIVCLGGPLPKERASEIIGWANDGRLYLLAEELPDD